MCMTADMDFEDGNCEEAIVETVFDRVDVRKSVPVPPVPQLELRAADDDPVPAVLVTFES